MNATDTPRSAQRTLFVLLIASLALVGMVLRPFAVALFLAIVLSGALWPTHSRFTRTLGGRPKLSATLLLMLVVLLFIGPILGLSAFVVKEVTEAIQFITRTLQSQGMDGLLSSLPDGLERLARMILERIPLEGAALAEALEEQVAPRSGQAAAAVGSAIAQTGSFLFQAVMMLIAFFFFLVQKESILSWVDDASPLQRGQTRELLVEFRRVTVAVMRSSILTALVQAIAAFIGFLIARVPHPIFFASVTFFFALIPAVGGASVCVIAAVLLFVTGHPIAAIFLAAWGVVVVGLSDNVVKPLLIKGGVEMSGAVVFFSLLGGLAAFGAIGLLLGPLAVALFVSLLRIYRRDYGEGPLPGGGHTVTEAEAERILQGTPGPEKR
ncbi:MAG: AI-2E family transporter [Myxococcaceae bacterium]